MADKSPLAPPFDKAQGMLFQRGLKKALTTTSPFEKGNNILD